MTACHETFEHGVTLLRPLDGRLRNSDRESLEVAELFQQHITAALARGHVIVDLSAFDWFGDYGRRALMFGAKAARTGSRIIALAAPAPVVCEKLLIARFHLVLPIFDRIEDAVAAIKTGDRSKALKGLPYHAP